VADEMSKEILKCDDDGLKKVLNSFFFFCVYMYTGWENGKNLHVINGTTLQGRKKN